MIHDHCASARTLLMVIILVGLVQRATGVDLWIEGESAVTRNVTRHGWYDSVKRDALSGGQWISHYSAEGPGEVGYEVDIPESGPYVLWVRANHLNASMSIRFNDGPWQPVDFGHDRRGAQNIADDNKPDMRFISWNRFGDVELQRGPLMIRFRFDSRTQNHGAIDAFVLTSSGFVPSGILRPGTEGDAQADEWFPVLSDNDRFDPASVTDLSALVSAPAGQRGFLQRDGGDLRFERGEAPVKFWAIGSGPMLENRPKTPDEMKQAAKWYRKHGINLVRQHPVTSVTGLLNREGKFDPQRLDLYDRWFATLKEYGIYSTGFYEFVRNKYQTRDAVEQAWGGKWDRDDRWDRGELGLMAAFHWGAEGPMYEFAGQHRRAGDYIEFLARMQRDYYQRRYGQLREIGYRGIIVTTAWKAIGASALANLWADDVGDLIDRHNYFGGGAGGHRIQEGAVRNASQLDSPGRGLFAIHQEQIANKPFAVSEWSHLPPSPTKAESAPLMAFYGLGLQDWDISYHFTTDDIRMGDGWPGLGKYVSATPHYIGQFPALARSVHEGHLQPGGIVADRRVSLAEVFAGRDRLGQSIAGEEHDIKDFQGSVLTPPEAFAMGQVVLAFDPDTDTQPAELDRWWDREQHRITSTTGELVWDVSRGLVEVRAPRSQGLIGRAKGGEYALPAVTVSNVDTPFVSLLITSLDGAPLIDAKQILITAMARDKQSGAEFNDDWTRLTQMGSPPLLMEPVQATLTFLGEVPYRIRACGVDGVPRGEPLRIESDGSFRIDGTHRSYYYFVERP